MNDMDEEIETALWKAIERSTDPWGAYDLGTIIRRLGEQGFEIKRANGQTTN